MDNREKNSTRRTLALLTVCAIGFSACGADEDDDDIDDTSERTEVGIEVADVPAVVDTTTTVDRPADVVERAEADEAADRSAEVVIAPDATWQWQLQGDINTSYDADVYDIDLFDTPQAVIDGLHASGRIVICYYSAGSYEEWRADAAKYPSDALGGPLDGWEGERWVDTRSDAVRSILEQRHDLAVAKRCDGVEPDNVTAFQNDSGFDLTAGDQLDFNRFLAASAHERGLLIALKNNLSQIPQLVADFDFAINEECLEFDECEAYAPFVEAGKAVLNAEYATRFVNEPDSTCVTAASFGLSTLMLPLDLDDSFRIAC